MLLITAKHVEQIQSGRNRATDLRITLEALSERLAKRTFTHEADVHSNKQRIAAENVRDDIDEAASLIEDALAKLRRASDESVDFYLSTAKK